MSRKIPEITEIDEVAEYLRQLQDELCDNFERFEPSSRFSRRPDKLPDGSQSAPRILTGGIVFEKAAVNFTHGRGESLPAAASSRKPEIAGAPFEAVSLSLISHPVKPYVPTSHMKLRFFIARPLDLPPVWWFGGGFDLTPYYGFEEDAIHWHRCARDACLPLGDSAYSRFKDWCDEYFFLPHREEARGIGGLFFDDLKSEGFPKTFEFLKSVGRHFLPAYIPIVEKHKDKHWGERERNFQLFRRGRYAEFNLVYDRGTLYGLQSGRKVESVLSSLPPLVKWEYNFEIEDLSPESRLKEFLVPREWLNKDS